MMSKPSTRICKRDSTKLNTAESSTNKSVSDAPSSGLKYISSQILDLFQKNQSMNYDSIVENIHSSNQSTLRRRVYDVLTVFRALGYVQKQGKSYIRSDINILTPQSYYILNENDNLESSLNCSTNDTKNKNDLTLYRTINMIRKRVVAKRNELKNLVSIRNSLNYIIQRNKRCELPYDKLFAPFVILTTNKNVQVNCETNEERSFFRIQSKENINIVDDLDVMKEIYEASVIKSVHPSELDEYLP